MVIRSILFAQEPDLDSSKTPFLIIQAFCFYHFYQSHITGVFFRYYIANSIYWSLDKEKPDQTITYSSAKTRFFVQLVYRKKYNQSDNQRERLLLNREIYYKLYYLENLDLARALHAIVLKDIGFSQ